jgi:undecaprenyl-diphosphatase
MDDIQALNLELFFAINNELKSPLGDVFLGYTTYLGDGMVMYPLAVVGLFLIDRKRFWTHFGLVALAAILGGVVLQVLKSYFNAPRPLAFFAEAIERGEVVVNVMFEPLRARSFPSGHSQTAFTFAHIFSFLLTRTSLTRTHVRVLQILFYGLATLTSISRVYVGVHFPIDILAGAMIGIFFSQLVIWGVRFYETSNTLKPSSSN